MTFIATSRANSGGRPPAAATSGEAAAVADLLVRPLALARGSAREELRCLAGEADPRLFFESLLGFAQRQEQAGHLELAATIYSLVAESEHAVPFQAAARHRLDAMLGRGASGARTEFLLRRFAREAADPAALAAMGAAGAVYRLTRVATLTRLALSPSANVLTRGWGARAVAGLTGFALEAPAFTFVGRGAHQLLGREQDWTASALSRDLASSFLVLGGLKAMGCVSATAAGAVRERPVQMLLQQSGMLSGILLGHRLEAWAGLRPHQDGATLLTDSLVMLLQFHVAGRLTQSAFGPRFAAWERGLELRGELLTRFPVLPDNFPGVAEPVFAGAVAGGSSAGSAAQNDPFGAAMAMLGDPAAGGRDTPSSVRLPKLGVRPRFEGTTNERLNREEAARQLRELMPQGLLVPTELERPEYVSRLLTVFGVTPHEFDQAAFRSGYEIARRHPGRVARLAFDVDEVYLHWAFSPADLFSGTMERGAETVYRNTDPSLLDYPPFQTAPEARLNFFERIWFEGIQRMLPSRFRQHVQFHPGVRAFQLGLRLGQEKNLIMATTGPAGRILRLANEDPAMRMIYFGKGPTEPVTIGEVRDGLNIYTREDLVLAMREALDGEVRYPENALVESYLSKVREFPARGVKLKHPALSVLRGKRPFDTLVDDSASTYEMLADVVNFSVLQPPSARPSGTLNFTLFSPERYLRRMANGYVDELGRVLSAPERPASRRLSAEAKTPEDYPLQRFTLEIPWRKFGAEFVAPNRELRLLGARLAKSLPSSPEANDPTRAPLVLNADQLHRLGDRLFRELETVLDQRHGEVAVETERVLLYRDLAQNSREDFQALLERHFTQEEIARLPQANLLPSQRGAKFYSRIAGLMAIKRAVCQLLGLDPAEHSRDVGFRFGRPALRGKAGMRLGGANLLTTLADDGEVGVGIALLEPSPWESGIVGLGVDLTTDRVRYTRPSQHALAEASYKATLQVHPIRRFNHHRAEEIAQRPDGAYILSGHTMRAARELRGDTGNPEPLEVPALHFRLGPATVALVTIPAVEMTAHARRVAGLVRNPANDADPVGRSPAPYVRDPDGFFQLPREGLTVVTLGDVGGSRSIELARQGHASIHIERDPEMLEMAERLFRSALDGLVEPEDRAALGKGEFLLGDWYGTQAAADRVEAYYPMHQADVPPEGSPHRDAAIRDFLDVALVTKLAPGGAGFVVSEVASIIRDLVRAVRLDPRLEMVEEAYDRHRPPLQGGYGVTSGFRQNSWVVFRRKPE